MSKNGISSEPSLAPDHLKRFFHFSVLSLLLLALAGCWSQKGGTPTPLVHLDVCPASRAQQGPSPFDLPPIQMVSSTTGWGLIVDQVRGNQGMVSKTGVYHLIRTTDGGCRWQVIKTWKLAPDGMLDLVYISANAALVMTREQGYRADQLYHTNDAGKTWAQAALPLSARLPFFFPTFSDPEHGWLLVQRDDASSFPLFSTRDAGQHWTQVQLLRDDVSSVPGISESSSIEFLDQNTGWLENPATVRPKRRLFITHDGGRSWTPQVLALPQGVKSTSGLMLELPHIFSARDAIISGSINEADDGTPNGFLAFVTQNGGLSWQSRPFVTEDLNTVYEKTLKPGELNDAVYRVTPPPYFSDMHFGVAGRIGLEMLTTNDDGQHWQSLGPRPRSFPESVGLAPQFVFGNVAFVQVPDNELHRTTDGGKTWTQLSPTVA